MKVPNGMSIREKHKASLKEKDMSDTTATDKPKALEVL